MLADLVHAFFLKRSTHVIISHRQSALVVVSRRRSSSPIRGLPFVVPHPWSPIRGLPSVADSIVAIGSDRIKSDRV